MKPNTIFHSIALPLSNLISKCWCVAFHHSSPLYTSICFIEQIRNGKKGKRAPDSCSSALSVVCALAARELMPSPNVLKLNLKCSLTSIFRFTLRALVLQFPCFSLSSSCSTCVCTLFFSFPYFLFSFFGMYKRCQRHLNLQTLTKWGKWNQITTITMHGNHNNEVEINSNSSSKNQSIHLT